jgi:long-chain fatty acid transport protein
MKFKQTIVSWSVAGAVLAMSGSAVASGFALIEQSASGLGNAYAGGAASAEDASTVFFNPAGMSRLSGKQIVVAGHAITPSAKFSNNGSVAASAQTLGGTGGDAGGMAFVPNAYFAMEVNPAMKVGLGINAPFGLQTEYDSNWMGRFQAVKSKIQTVNLNPSISYDVNEKVSVGVGLNYQHIKGDLTSAVNYSAAAAAAAANPLTPPIAVPGLLAVAGAQAEGVSTISGSDSSWGYNLGVLMKLGERTRIGAAYRSTIKYTLAGTVSFTGVPAILSTSAKLQNGDVTLPITMPDSFSLSGVHKLSDSYEVMGDATWTGWSVLQQLKIDRTSGVNVQTVDEKWKDTWRVSVGASHHYNENLTVRTGIAFDQAPVSDSYRTARIPDNDRTWLSLGGQYKMSAASVIDFGYAHLFVKDSNISDIQNVPAQGKAGGNLIGTYKNSVDILSAQYTHNF